MVFSVEAFLVTAVLKSLETAYNISLDIVGNFGGQVLRAISVPLKLLGLFQMSCYCRAKLAPL